MEAYDYFKSRVPGKPSYYTTLDYMYAFFSENSGLTPAAKYSINDHMRAYFIAQNGPAGKASLSELETRFYANLGIDTSKGMRFAREAWHDLPIGPPPDTTAPSVPTGLSATTGDTQVTLNWNASTDDTAVTGYRILQDGVPVTTSATNSKVITGLTNGQTYQFRVKAYDAAGNESAASAAVNPTLPIPDTTPPAVPSLFTVEPGNTSALLEWDDNTDDTTLYEIFQNGSSIGTTAVSTAVVSSLTNGTPYAFKIRARDAAGNNSAFTEEYTVIPYAPDVTAPTVPTGLSGTVGDTYVDLSWVASTDAVGVAGYTIRKDGVILDSTVDTTYRATGLTNGQSYTFSVAAYDAAGNSSAYTAGLARTPVSSEPSNWVRTWLGLGLANGAVVTTSSVGPNSPTDDVWSGVSNSPVLRVDNSGPAGAERVMLTVPNSTTATQWRWNDRAQGTFQFREYIEVGGAIPTASTGVILHATKTTGGQLFRLVVSSTNRINIQNAANTFIRQSEVVPAGLYRLEVWRDGAVDQLEIRMYNCATGNLFYSTEGLSTPLGTLDTLDDLIIGRQSGAAFGPWYMGGFVLGNAVGEIGPDDHYEVEAVTYRNLVEHPFAAGSTGSTNGSFWNTTVSTDVTWENPATGNKTKNVTDRAGLTIFTMNYTAWTVRRIQTTLAMPLITLRRPGGGDTWYSHLHLDPNFTPPLPSNGDRNCVIVDVDGVTAYDCFKLTKISDTVWESSSVDVYRLDGLGHSPGVRAANVPLAGGQIMQSRVDRIKAGEVNDFGHVFAISFPKSILTLDVTSADGEVFTSFNGKGVRPANQIDNQANVPYAGTAASGWAMGAMLIIPPTVSIDSLSPGNLLERAVLNNLQRFGAVITDQSDTIALYGETTISTTDANQIISAWRNKAAAQLRRVTSNLSTTGYGGRPLAGGTTRLAPGEPLLPVDPTL